MTDQENNNKNFSKRAWKLIYPYWFSEDKWLARVLLGVIVGLNLGMVYITVLLNKWYGGFYDSLQKKDFPSFKSFLVQFCVLAFFYIVVAVYRSYLQQMLEIRWRKWLTDKYLTQWMTKSRFYILQLKDFGTDNPDQRIAEDLKNLASATLSLSLGFLSSLVTLCSFFMILWGLSGPLAFSVGGIDLSIPGYMVWVALVYALVGSLLTHYIGRSLIKLNFDQQRYEADFRFSLVRVRENSEAIALSHGEIIEQLNLTDKFKYIWTNWREIMRYQKRLTWFIAAYSQLASIFPIVVAAPRYFGGLIELGALMQISSAFGRVQDALSWFIESYSGANGLTAWKASVDRLLGFENACDEADKLMQAREANIKVSHRSDVVEISDVTLALPDGKLLSKNISKSIRSGEKILLKGSSGTGKSTLMRTLAGGWPFAKGSYNVPPQKDIMFLPQKPYLPIGTLRNALFYPQSNPASDDATLVKILEKLDLSKFSRELDKEDDWSKRLSLGEQQRIALARVLIQRPKWVFLDEATASLDPATSEKMHKLIDVELSELGIIEITHSEQRDTPSKATWVLG